MREELKNTVSQNVAGGLQSPSLACCKELALICMWKESRSYGPTQNLLKIRHPYDLYSLYKNGFHDREYKYLALSSRQNPLTRAISPH